MGKFGRVITLGVLVAAILAIASIPDAAQYIPSYKKVITSSTGAVDLAINADGSINTVTGGGAAQDVNIHDASGDPIELNAGALPVSGNLGRNWFLSALSDSALIGIIQNGTNNDVDVSSLNGVAKGSTTAAAVTVHPFDANTNGIATSVVQVLPGTGATLLGKARGSAGGTTDTGVAVYGINWATGTHPSTAVGQWTQLSTDGFGALYERPQHPNPFQCAITSTATTATQFTGCTGGGDGSAQVGLRYYITDIEYSSSIVGSTANFLTLTAGSGAACGTATATLWRMFNSVAFEPVAANFRTPIFTGQNLAICFTHPGAGTRVINVRGFVAP